MIFDDAPRQIFWWYPLNYSYVNLDETELYKGKKSARITLEPKQYSGAGTNFQELDLTELRAWGALEYWVKGDSGGEHFTHGLRSYSRGSYSVISGPDIRYYTEVTRKWQKVSVPLADFTPQGSRWDNDQGRTILEDFYWDRVYSMFWAIAPVNEGEMVYFIDELRFVPKQTINMQKARTGPPTPLPRPTRASL